MAITGIKKAYFVVWTSKGINIEIIPFDDSYWQKVESNLILFFKSYVCPVLLNIKELYLCGKCDKVLPDQTEIDEKEEEEQNSVQCDRCSLWYHLKCEHLSVAEAEKLPDEWYCESCLLSV